MLEGVHWCIRENIAWLSSPGVKDFRGHDAGNCVFFLFGAVPNVCTVMPSRHVRQSDVNMIDRWTSADQLAS